MKTCNKCHVAQLETCFSRQKNTPDQLRYACRACTAIQSKLRNAKPEVKRHTKAMAKLWEIATGYRERRNVLQTNRRRANYVRTILNSTRGRARKRNIPFDLVSADLFIPEVCPLLELKLDNTKNHRHAASPSLDRKDPNSGYVKGNVQIICAKANSIKSDATFAELQLLTRNLRKLMEEHGLVAKETLQLGT